MFYDSVVGFGSPEYVPQNGLHWTGKGRFIGPVYFRSCLKTISSLRAKT
jgi:hypothetical protein